MATINDRQVNANFSGLTSTAVTALVFLTIGVVLEEVLKRLRRYKGSDDSDRGVESWAMGYLYRARTYVPNNPTSDYSKYPLVWIWRAVACPQKFFEDHAGEDATVYVRFLRGCFYWTLLQSCTIFPVIISINFIYSPEIVSTTSIDRASLSALTQSDSGKRLLWVHVICIWFLSGTWIATLAWIGYGAIRVRRNVLRRLAKGISGAEPGEKAGGGNTSTFEETQPQRLPLAMELERQLVPGPVQQGLHLGVDHHRDRGWRHRTILLRNIPESMRSEEAIAAYFAEHLRAATATPPETNLARFSTLPHPGKDFKLGYSTGFPDKIAQGLISDIVLVRKQYELNETFNKYRETQYLLETAHAALAIRVVSWARKQMLAQPDREKDAREGDAALLDSLKPFLEAPDARDSSSGRPRCLWAVLEAATPQQLDRFQPLIKLKHFRGQAVPAIDYYLTKLNLLSALITAQRAPDKFEAASTAFVTFRSASDARRARLELKTRPGSKLLGKSGTRLGAFECKVTKAPEVRDLDWNRLVLVSLSSDIVRGAVLTFFIWVATLFWVIPLSFLVGLLSLQSIGKYIPALATYLESHSATNSLFSNLLPTSIVALLGMLVPTLIGILTRNGQTFITVSKLHAAVQARYWKWLLVNIVIFFCVGMTAFTAVLNAFKQPTSVLSVVAAAFPKGATFFVSWLLLTIGVHHGIEHSLFGIPFINHGTIRKLQSPRKREELAQPRSFSYFYWVPNHLLVLAVTAIFAILNPLVIPFSLVYFSFALIVFKNQFAHVYWRRWYELGGRLVFRRCFRYSLDTFILAQVVAVALLWVLKFFKLGGATIPLIPITAFVKLIGTRWYEKLMDEIDEAEIDLICGESGETPLLSVPLTAEDRNMRSLGLAEAFGTASTFATRTLPSLTFRPHEKLPSVPSPSKFSTTLRVPSFQSAPSHALTGTATEDRTPTAGSSPLTEQRHRATLTSEARVAIDSHPSFSALVTKHAPVIRDDRPVSHHRYHNPAVEMPLAHSLWLPRNPLLPLDLGDTVDYHGRALVSSEGGSGMIGTWEDTEAAADAASTRSAPPILDSLVAHIDSGSPTELKSDSLERVENVGSKRILVATDVALQAGNTGGNDANDSGSTRAFSVIRRGSGSTQASTTPTMSRSRSNTSHLNTPTHAYPPGSIESLPHPSLHPPPPRSSSTSPRHRPTTDDYFSPPLPNALTSSLEPLSPPRDRSSSQSSQGRASVRARRSASQATSQLPVQMEGDEDGVEATITQADALRSEIVAEAKAELSMYRESEKSRRRQEKSDSSASVFKKWFARDVASAPEI